MAGARRTNASGAGPNGTGPRRGPRAGSRRPAARAEEPRAARRAGPTPSAGRRASWSHIASAGRWTELGHVGVDEPGQKATDLIASNPGATCSTAEHRAGADAGRAI